MTISRPDAPYADPVADLADTLAALPDAPVSASRRRHRQTEAMRGDKRTAILRVAAQLFATYGYEATSLDRIASALGMHKATLYHYVESKESILYQCLTKSFGDLDEVVLQMEDRSIAVAERMRSFAQSLARAQNNEFGRCLVLVGVSPLDKAPGGEIRKFQKRLDTTVRNLVVQGIADGSFKPCHPGLVSAMLFGMLSWVPRWYDKYGKLRLDEVIDAFMDMLTEGIAAR